MKQGSVIPLLFLLIIGLIGYWIFINFSQTPNPRSNETAKTIYKYPRANYWEFSEQKNLCILPQGCLQPTIVSFATNDNWPNVYLYYKQTMINFNWTTNSQIITSLPSSITFDKNNCQAHLRQYKPSKFAILESSNIELNRYRFAVTCTK